jgi:hypothetical protein
MLGLAPCYHMVTVLGDLNQAPMWERAVHGDVDWNELLGGYESTVDWPGGLFYKEILDAYPEAKVLLSTRDPESWQRSMRDTVWAVRHGNSLMRLLSDAQAHVNPAWAGFVSMIDSIVWDATFHHFDSPEQMIETFERHNAQVKATVPPEKLLVWEVSDGWEPLCEFMQLPVPDMPFPHMNDSLEFVNRIIDGSLLALTEWRAKGDPIPAEVAAER